MRRTILSSALLLGLAAAPHGAEAKPSPHGSTQVELPETLQHLARAPDERALTAYRALDLDTFAPHAQRFARLARAFSHYRLAHYPQAQTDFASVAADADAALGDLAAFYEAESAFHRGRYVTAQQRYETLIEQRPWSHWTHRARMRVADCLMARGRATLALAQLDLTDRRYPEYAHPAAASIMRGDAEQLRDQPKAAAQAYAHALLRWPKDPITDHARSRLAQLDAQGVRPPNLSPQTRLDLAINLRTRKYFDEALTQLHTLLEQPQANAQQRYQAQIQIGRTLYQQEALPAARDHFLKIEQTAASAGQRRTAAWWRSQVLAQMGQTQEAVDAYLLSRPNPARLDAESTEKVAWFYFDGALYPEAAEWFHRTAAFGGKWRGSTAFWRVWLAYRTGAYDAALKGFQSLAAQSRARSDRYDYWIARILAKQGHTEAALDTWRGIVSSAPLSYYAYQAKARIVELGAPLDPERELPSDPEAEDDVALPPSGEQACSEPGECEPTPQAHRPPTLEESPEDQALLLADELGMAPPEAEAPEAPQQVEFAALKRLAQDYGGTLPRLRAAYELALLGQNTQAAWALREVRDEWIAFRRATAVQRRRWRYLHKPYVDNRKDTDVGAWGSARLKGEGPLASDEKKKLLARPMPAAFSRDLKLAYGEVGDHFYVRRMGGAGKLRSPPEAEAHNAPWRIQYPRAFAPLVGAYAQQKALDPYFIWALMNVESAFNPWAISRVGARGLMQVMPHTGALVAERMGLHNFGTPSLFEPEVVIEQASWYFSQLLHKFNGQLPFAIAGYNAGPHRVAAWLQRKGHLDMDEFIEEMPYTEAREYTKKVLRFLALYRRIYEGAERLQIPQTIDPNFRDNINF